MTPEERFQAAQKLVKALSTTPGPNELLELYGWYKQATMGDVTGTRPGAMNFKARAKYDAWASCQGETAEAAMQRYAEVVDRLRERYA